MDECSCFSVWLLVQTVLTTSVLLRDPNDLGQQTFQLATANGASLRYFEQGIRYLWAADGTRAAASFRESHRLDPNCSLCFWGEGLALGPNLDSFDDPLALKQVPQAAQCASKALYMIQTRPTTLSELSRDKGLVQALVKRYSNNLAEYTARRGDFQRAYAWAMEGVAADNPTDVDVKAFAAEAWMLTMQWDYWAVEGTPDATSATEHALQLLEAALQQQPQHAGALRLKARVMSGGPYKRNTSMRIAQALERLMPGSPEFQQAAGSAYFRASAYDNSCLAYQRAVDAGNLQVHPLRNLESLVYGLRATGQYAAALQASMKLQRLADMYLSAEKWDVGCQAERYSMQHALTLLFFSRHDEVLGIEGPSANRTFAGAVWRFARGMASVNLGLAPQAMAELAELQGLAVFISESLKSDPLKYGRFQAQAVCNIYAALLRAQVQRIRRPGLPIDIASLKRAVILAESLPWDEPPQYYLSPLLFLGAALLARGDNSGASEAFGRVVSKDTPFRPLALFGLCEATAAGRVTNKSQECDDAARLELKSAWRNADADLRAPFAAVVLKQTVLIDVTSETDEPAGKRTISLTDQMLQSPGTWGSIAAYAVLAAVATCFLCRSHQADYAPIGMQESESELSSSQSSARTLNSATVSQFSSSN
eukprot:gnl/MRDRNA2_/MRDRNA2_77415_c0_seq1.p1 gnl/MRDRNA2_/MRDRNA2_77415_c0~~gnl/MRDRNA2_/MRDRNA2_77415_c0_seq1.p1  ORF type:complete len:653 (-),score=121.37 gnl/MRDRNA2_/MRDRNA2_77415_c0_seq1:95-2053(-)